MNGANQERFESYRRGLCISTKPEGGLINANGSECPEQICFEKPTLSPNVLQRILLNTICEIHVKDIAYQNVIREEQQ